MLVVLAIPLFSITLGQPDNGTNPTSQSNRQAYDLISQGFGVGANGPLTVVVKLPDQSSSANSSLLSTMQSDIAKTAGVASVTPASVNSSGTTAVFNVIPTTRPQATQTTALVTTLRDDVLPKEHATSYVTGTVAGNVDFTNQITSRLLWLIIAVVAISFFLLTAAFRSIVIAIKAAILNILSIGAAYGVIVAIFEWGWGKSAIGLQSTLPIPAYVPMLVFCIVFGLSMDYEVFLLSRVHEAWLATGDAHRSVAIGIGATARVITTAALIMIVVFTSFVLNPDPTVKMLAIGMAFAVLIDASLVRMILVPSIMSLLGARAWWLPRWLAPVVPNLQLEGPVAVPEARAALIDTSADPDWLQEGLVTEVVVLADEGLEVAQAIGVASLAGIGIDVEVLPQVRQVPLEVGDVYRVRQTAEDLVHGEEPAVVAEDRVHRVVGRVGLLDEIAGSALMVKGAADLVAQCTGDGRRERVAYLAIGGRFPAGELPAVLIAVPALDARDHLGGELGYQRDRVVGRRRSVGYAERVHAEQPPGPLGAGRSQVGAAMLLGLADDRRRSSVAATRPRPGCSRLRRSRSTSRSRRRHGATGRRPTRRRQGTTSSWTSSRAPRRTSSHHGDRRLAEQAAEASQALRETLQRATLAAEALALPESRESPTGSGAPEERSGRRRDRDVPAEFAQPLSRSAGWCDLHHPVRGPVGGAPLDGGRCLALDELLRRAVAVIEEEHASPGARAAATRAQKDANRSAGTCDSQQPMKTTS